MSKAISWIRSKQNAISAFAPWFFASYFLLLVIPYSTGRIPVLYAALCVNVIGRVLFRLIPTAYLFAYGLLSAIANKTRFRWEWMISMILLWIGYILTWIFIPDTYVYISQSWNISITYTSITVGWQETLIAFLTMIAETTMFVFWLSFFPSTVKTKKAIVIPLLTMVLFAWLSIILSVAIEWNLYMSLFKGSDHKLIHSIFSQKNEFGAFLFIGTFASAFLCWFLKGKKKIIFAASSFVLTVFTLIIRCYTALASEVVVMVALIILAARWLNSKKPYLGIAVAGGMAALLAGFIATAFIPAFRSNVPVFKIIYSSFNSLGEEIATRTVIWEHLPDVAGGHNIFLGLTDTVSDTKVAGLQIVQDESVVAIFHNSYIAYLAIHGIAGLLIYFAVIFKAIKNGVAFKKKGIAGSIFLLLLLLGYLLQGMAETYVLFIKMSVLTLPLTYVFYVFVPAMNKGDVYE